jgi:hypothetical protein
LYKGSNVKYLCYNAQYNLPCHVQQPMILGHFEEELRVIVQAKAQEALRDMENEFESRGYDVTSGGIDSVSVEIVPEKIRIRINAPMSVSKEGTQSYERFNFEYSSKMYDLLMIATSIVDFESTYGDAETTLYTQYYPTIRILKDQLGDGTTVYTVSDVETEETFRFASRSVAWPGGYGLGE